MGQVTLSCSAGPKIGHGGQVKDDGEGKSRREWGWSLCAHVCARAHACVHVYAHVSMPVFTRVHVYVLSQVRERTV